MQVFTSLKDIPKIPNLVLTIGTFDGVHLGHRHIIKKLVDKAKQLNGKSAVMTFHPHPRQVLNPSYKSLKLLSTIPERAKLLQAANVDGLFVVPFSVDFANLSPETYIETVLVNNIDPKVIIVGYDHQFGKNRAGNISTLIQYKKKFGYQVEQVEKQVLDNVTLSSTKIRHALKEGHIKKANSLLGYGYQLQGYVVHGEQKGREMGFPTANITLEDNNKLIPANGVYAVTCKVLGQNCYGMLNIGTRPTFAGEKKTIEVHILNFNKNIYGEGIGVTFAQFLRKEKSFAGMQELSKQLEKDKETVVKLFGI